MSGYPIDFDQLHQSLRSLYDPVGALKEMTEDVVRISQMSDDELADKLFEIADSPHVNGTESSICFEVAIRIKKSREEEG